MFKRYLGMLLCYENTPSCEQAVIHTEDFSFVRDPYLLGIRELKRMDVKVSALVWLYSRLLVVVCRWFFPLLYIFPYIVRPVYRDAGEANAIFYRLFPYERQHKLCLPRAVFTATLSKCFRSRGTLFVGAFLPTTHLHAWVVEDGMIGDPYDNLWIQFTPVMEWQWGRK